MSLRCRFGFHDWERGYLSKLCRRCGLGEGS